MSATIDLAPLQKPELVPVWSRIREYLERYGWAKLGSVAVGLDAKQVGAVAALTGNTRLRPGRVRLDLAQLDVTLRSSRLEMGLVEALEQVGGPLEDRRQMRKSAAALEADKWERLNVHANRVHPGLAEWLAKMRRRGTARRVAGDKMHQVLEQVLTVISQLPAEGLVLQRLAVRIGSAHDLDWNQPLGGLTLSALAHLRGQQAPTSALGRRQLWAEFGVTLDTVSATVLALNLRPASGGLAAGILRACTEAGEPASLTLGQLKLTPLTFESGHEPVLVCENPPVMEDIKTMLGVAGPPMVCVAGRFNSAAATLLRYLASSGVKLQYHGDFDYAGIAIANEVIARFGAKPLRFDTASYLHALKTPGYPPEGRRVEASWDSHLASAIADHNRAIHEEAVVEDVVSELRQFGGCSTFKTYGSSQQ